MTGSSLSCFEAMVRARAVQLVHRAAGSVTPPAAVPKATRKSHYEWERTRVLLICGKLVEQILTSAADGVRHVVEVAFAEDDTKLPIVFGVSVTVTVVE